MRNLKKIITISLLVFTFFVMGAVSVFANGFEKSSDAQKTEAVVSLENEVISKESISSESDTAKDNPNVFEDAFSLVQTFSAELMCSLTFIGSLIVAFAYRKGLVPTIKSGLGNVGNLIQEVRDNTESYTKHQDEVIAGFTERLAQAEKILEKFAVAIDEIEKKTEDGEKVKEDRECVKALMSAQIDLLYDIFMTSSLPQYQKDAVGKRISKMKEVSSLAGKEQ